MTHKAIIPPGSAPPLAPYSPGVSVAGIRAVIHVSGMLALDASGQVVGPGDAGAQTRCVLESIRAVIEAGGGTLADVAFNQIFLANLADYAAMNAVYREYFPGNHPARYCIRADLVKPEFLVEIASTAYLTGAAPRARAARPRARKAAPRKAVRAPRAGKQVAPRAGRAAVKRRR